MNTNLKLLKFFIGFDPRVFLSADVPGASINLIVTIVTIPPRLTRDHRLVPFLRADSFAKLIRSLSMSLAGHNILVYVAGLHWGWLGKRGCSPID